MTRSPFAPNEPSDIIRDEVAWLQGAFLSSLLCGVQITLSAMSFFAVLKQPMRRRLRIIFLVYVFLLCAIMTAGQQLSLSFIQLGFIEYRKFPGGPNEFLSIRYSTPVEVASTSLFVFANWMMESLLVWRCKVVCKTGDKPVWIGVIFPPMLLVAEFVTGGLYLYQMLRHKHMIKYTLAYSSLSLLLNVSVTVIIAGRLLLHRRRMVKLFGPGHGSQYASVAAIVIESASLYTGFVILVIIFFCVGTSASNILQQTVAQVESIATLLIIYRIARGKEWRVNNVVESADWKGDSEQRAEIEATHTETAAAGPVQASVHARTMSSKEDETQPPMSTSSVGATPAVCDAV